jgi:Putative zinc-finger
MEHSFIEQTDIIDRYVRGTMPPAERFEFEEHFLDCQECLEQLEIARSLREGMKVCAAQPSARAATQSRVSSWFSWRPVAAGAMAVLLLSAIPSVVLYRSLNGALDRETRRADQLANAPLLPPAVYTLSPTRGAQAAHAISIPESPRWILLALELDTSQYHDYRAILQDGAGQPAWTSGSLKADAPDAIGVAFPSRILHPGDFVLVVEGRRADGGYESVTGFPLRAVEGTPR